MTRWIDSHASPNWVKSKMFLEDYYLKNGKEATLKAAEELAFKYPSWFFELYAELNGNPLVLEKYQIDYLLDRNTFTIMNKSRQAGGSLSVSLKKFYTAFRNEAYRCDIVSINLKEAMDKIRYVKSIHESLPERYRIPMTVSNQTSAGFHKGMKQSVINSIAASTGVRGGRKEIVFDEFAHIANAEDLYIGAAPAIIRGDQGLDIVSTPAGNLDLFSKIWKNEKDYKGEYPFNDYSRHEFIWCDVHEFVTDYDGVQHAWNEKYNKNMDYMPELVNEFATPKLKSFAGNMPWSQFLQEFCGVFLDETTAFFPQALIKDCLRPPYARDIESGLEEREYLEIWNERPEGNANQVYMGVDYGESDKDTDKTSIQILERLPDGHLMHRYSEVLNKKDFPNFPAQARHIVHVYKKFKPNKVTADHTGLGRGINPQVREICPEIPLEELTFDYVNKEEMVMNLKNKMEKGTIWLQQDDTRLQGEIRNIERRLTLAGRATYHGQPHDDMFWALAMAARAGGYSHFGMFTFGAGKLSASWEMKDD